MATDTSNAYFEYPRFSYIWDEIRLLTIDSIDGEGTPICSLRNVALDSKPEFVALSYIWGLPDPKYLICVNDQPFWVRSNLYSFIMLSASNLVGVSLFVDAICIDQSNLRECARQVECMPEIYSSATMVIAWTGVQRVAVEDLTADHVLTNDYWSRLWVVQEVTLARDLIIHASDCDYLPISFSQEDLRAAQDPISKEQDFEKARLGVMVHGAAKDLVEYNVPSSLQNIGIGSDADTFRKNSNAARGFRILNQRHHWHTVDELPPLHGVITTFGSYESTRRLDKVYGLLGISKTCIHVDYERPVLDLYLEVLIEGFYELAAETRHSSASASAFRTKASEFHLACMASLGLGNDLPICLTTYRAMQHAGLIPLSYGLSRGIAALLIRGCLCNPNRPFRRGMWRVCQPLWLSAIYSWCWTSACLLDVTLQTHRHERWAFAPNQDKSRARLFAEWIVLVDEIADDVDLKADCKRPTHFDASGPVSAWRTASIGGIPGGRYGRIYGNAVGWMVIIVPWTLWKGYNIVKDQWRACSTMDSYIHL